MANETQYNGTLLVVDDFELNRDMLSRRLRTRGFEVYCASGGKEALEKIAQFPCDLILLDIMMPDMDGYEVLSHLRARYTSTDLAVIMVTAKDQSEDIVKALSCGADDYVTKPIDFPVAMARIQTQLERRATEIALRESEERYSLAAEGANDGLWDWNLRTHQVYFSDRWKRMLGYEPDEVGGHIDDWFNRVHKDDLYRLKETIDQHLKGVTPKFSCEYRMVLKDGSHHWMLCRGSVVRDEQKVNCRMVGWQTDTTNRVQHDSLTSLPNRALFLDRMNGAMARVKRTGQGFAVLYIGIDRFKIINESLGHEIGDRVLVSIVRRMETLLRPGDTMARLGGDEFSILAEDIRGIGHASQIANWIREEMSAPFTINDHLAHITISIGIVLGDKHSDNPEEILRRGHGAMSEAKSHGKNCYEFFSSDRDMVSTLQMENQLRRAMECKELFLAYQPQIDTRTGKIIGVEALLRWRNPKLGMVPPGGFIPLAEDTGLIVPIGEWVLKTACRQHREWVESGLPPLRIGVNISSRQFRKNNLVNLVTNTLEESGMAAHFLDLELTESLLMENLAQTIDALNNLHQLGVKISIDDFGTGYSSLAYLKRFQIDTLKIDRSFVKDITEDPDDAAISCAIIGMAHSLRMKVVAEGVETGEQLEYLKELGCDEMQGFYFSPATDPESIREMLLKASV